MIYYGTDEVSRGWDRYFALCNALEVESERKPPSIKTLNTWRVNSPKGFAFVLHAEPGLGEALVRGYERDDAALTDALHQAWEATEERAHALAAKAVLVQTPPEFRPSASSRALIERFGKEVASKTKRLVIWESSGLWSTEESRALAEEHGLAYAVDPFLVAQEELGFTSGDACFRITERAGMRRQFDQYDMEEMIGWAQHYDRTFVLMTGRFKWQHAKELSLVLREDDA